MKNYRLSADALVMVSGSSAGTQPKYYDKGYWYKTDKAGYEGEAEYLASLVLSCSNVKNYVTYEKCMINGKNGCRSKNFLSPDEAFISFQRLYDMYQGGSLLERVLPMERVEDRVSFVVDFINEYAGFDCTKYLSEILSLDYMLLNTDRHFHNLGIIVNREAGESYAAPIFDNGAALLSDYGRFPADISIEQNISEVYGQPFSSNLGMQAKCVGFGLKLDYDLLYDKLRREPETRAVGVLKYQLEANRKIYEA